jgi:hypothetical protein
LRVVLDTNVFISALLASGGPPARLIFAWLEGRFVLATGPEQLEELARTIRYPKVSHRIARADAGTLINEIRAVAVQIKRFPRVLASTDPDDNLLLGIAVAAGADYLVTGDKAGLLSLRRFKQVRIVTARELCQKLKIRA